MKSLCWHAGVRRVSVALLLVAATACTRRPDPPAEAGPSATSAAATAATPEQQIPPTNSPFDALPEAVRLVLDKPFTDDFDAMLTRRAIRVAVTFSRTHYFIDKGQERGLSYEALKAFETDLNTEAKTGNLRVHVVIIPMSRDQLYPALASGKVDMVAAMVTVRPELEALAAFSEPTRTNVSQVVVRGPGAPPIATLDALAGQEVFVRKASAYYESLARLNEQLKTRGKPAVVIEEAPDVLEDDDVLEMVNAGLAPITVVDQYFASEPMDQLNKALMTFASYNAGPGRLRQLRRETEKRGLDPNVWFGNVERVASERIGRETVTYVSNIRSTTSRTGCSAPSPTGGSRRRQIAKRK